MLGPTLILLGAVAFAAGGALVMRANPSIPISDHYKLRRTRPVFLPGGFYALWGLGLFSSSLGASACRDEIGWWSYLISVLTLMGSPYAGQVFQRRRMSPQNETGN